MLVLNSNYLYMLPELMSHFVCFTYCYNSDLTISKGFANFGFSPILKVDVFPTVLMRVDLRNN